MVRQRGTITKLHLLRGVERDVKLNCILLIDPMTHTMPAARNAQRSFCPTHSRLCSRHPPDEPRRRARATSTKDETCRNGWDLLCRVDYLGMESRPWRRRSREGFRSSSRAHHHHHLRLRSAVPPPPPLLPALHSKRRQSPSLAALLTSISFLFPRPSRLGHILSLI
jgi:hypothetical protein